MIDPILTTLIIALIAYFAGIVTGHVYTKVVANDTAEELMEDALRLLVENERLTAELDELRGRLDNLAQFRPDVGEVWRD